MGSAKADVLLYQNYTPGTTDYNTSEWRQINNQSPVFAYEYFPGYAKELTFTFTAGTSVIPRHVFLPMLINSYNAANGAAVIVDITEVGGDGRHWHASGSPATIAPTTALGDKKVYFAFTDGITPPTRIGYDYEVSIWSVYTDGHAYLSNVASDSSNYYTADVSFFEPTIYNIVNQPLATEAAVSIHGDIVAAPEPASMLLLASGALVMGRRRRRRCSRSVHEHGQAAAHR
jgi:hypothetical protein